MDISISFGQNLGLSHNVEHEATRGGSFKTHYLTLWRLHVIVSRRQSEQPTL